MPKPHDVWPPAPDLRRDDIEFDFRGNRFLGHLVAPPVSAGPRPLVMVIHNYQGLKFFECNRSSSYQQDTQFIKFYKNRE